MNEKILIVDDDISIQKILTKVIHNNELEPHSAYSGEEALDLIHKNSYDLILMDINMHKMDGFEVLQEIRAQKNNTPVIIVSARSEDYDTLYGLSIGADDYITKPFNPILLGAKVKALIRRDKTASISTGSLLLVGPFKYDNSTLKFYKYDTEIFLSSKENMMMKFFLENVNQVFSKSQLYEHIWGETIVDENAVMVYINRLRNKLEKDPKNPIYLQTVWGLGYKFTIS